MKKTFFLFAMLASVAASATVTVNPISTDYAAQKVTFRVAWTGSAYSNRVWVWIDLCPVSGVTSSTFQTAVISAASTISGSVTYASTNTRGFFVTTSPSTVTATLSNAAGKFNWCAYGSDYPPNVIVNNGTYTFKGTPPFILTAVNGTTTQTVTGNTLPASALTVTPVTLTDKTGYPGVFCIYSGSDLYIDATHFCQPRTTGAKNWEAWIKDTRDNELYRIVYMPDNKWWLAQNVKLASYGGNTVGIAAPESACTKDKCGRLYTPAQVHGAWGGTSGLGANIQGVCPPGWVLPVRSDLQALVNAISPSTWNTYSCGYYTINALAASRMKAKQDFCVGYDDDYGFAVEKASTDLSENVTVINGNGSGSEGTAVLVIQQMACEGYGCQNYISINPGHGVWETRAFPSRCFRTL
jgi:uncharacterized protein (TIGR02145 family)